MRRGSVFVVIPTKWRAERSETAEDGAGAEVGDSNRGRQVGSNLQYPSGTRRSASPSVRSNRDWDMTRRDNIFENLFRGRLA